MRFDKILKAIFFPEGTILDQINRLKKITAQKDVTPEKIKTELDKLSKIIEKEKM